MISSLESKSSKHEMNASIAPGVILSTEVDKTDRHMPCSSQFTIGIDGGRGLRNFHVMKNTQWFKWVWPVPRIGNPLLYLSVNVIMVVHSSDYNKVLIPVQIECHDSQQEVIVCSPALSTAPNVHLWREFMTFFCFYSSSKKFDYFLLYPFTFQETKNK